MSEDWTEIKEAMEQQIVEYESRGQYLYAGLGAPLSIRHIYYLLKRKKPQDLPARSPWISVEDRPPEHKQDVFATDGTIVYLAQFCDGDIKPMWFGMGITWEVDEAITHWTPIPELPALNKKDNNDR